MFSTTFKRRIAGALGALALVATMFGAPADSALAHARYVSHEPTLGAGFDGAPTTLRVTFSQELRLASAIKVSDGYGTQVDLGDGRVDQDDPDRKSMLVSLPWLEAGAYAVEYVAVSAEDDHAEGGSFAVGVGMDPVADVAPAPAVAPEPVAIMPAAPVRAVGGCPDSAS